MAEPQIKKEDAPPTEKRAGSGYKSWKKKYRKMRIVFDDKMHNGEELHKQEAKAASTVKRLAVENDRLLDLLLDINNSPHIPTDKRLDISLTPPADPDAPVLSVDAEHAQRKESARKKLEELLAAVPHSTFGTAKESQPSFVTDLSAPKGESHPASFLTADDIDNYHYAVDTGIDPEHRLPTLAPNAQRGSHNLASHPQLKNPTSVTNWLRKHAPNTFLQDGEGHGHKDHKDKDKDRDHEGDEDHHSARKSRGSRGERGGRGTSGSTRGKRTSTARRSVGGAGGGSGDMDASMDDDGELATPTASSKGGSKRKRDDDGGYRPKGGSGARPAKKKRKSEGEGAGSARKVKKEKDAAPTHDD